MRKVLGLLICGFSVAPRTVMLDLMQLWELSTPLVAILFSLTDTVPLAGIAIVSWFCLRREQFVGRLAHLSLRWWWLSGLAIVLLLYAARPFAMRLPGFLISLYGLDKVIHPSGFEAKPWILVGAWMQVWSGLQPLLWVLLVPLLASYAQRMRHAKPRLAASAGVAGIAAGQRELVEQFQSQGLPVEEACLLAARRQELRPTVVIEAPNTRQILVERTLWMVVGVVLNRLIYGFLLEPSWFIAALNNRLTNQASVYGYVLGGLGMLLELCVAALFLRALWRLVTRGHRANEWLASLCMKRPGLAALGLALIYLGMQYSFHLSFQLLRTIFAPNTFHHLQSIASQWFDRQYVIHQMVIPVALLLWLARSRMKLRRA